MYTKFIYTTHNSYKKGQAQLKTTAIYAGRSAYKIQKPNMY